MSGSRVKFGGDSSDALWIVGMSLLVGIGAWIWATGQLAGLLFEAAWIDVGVADLPGIAMTLPGTLGDPAQAWPQATHGDLPGPVGFTIAAILAGTIVTAATIMLAIGLTRFTASNGQNGMASGTDLDRKLSRAAAMRKARRLRPTLEGKPTLDHVAVDLGKAASGGKQVVADIENSVFVLAAPRQGKSSQVLIPWLARWQGPALATSVRPDIVEATYTFRKEQGPVAVLDLSDTPWPEPLKWSPVAGCEDYDKARRRAKVMIGTGEAASENGNAEFFRSNAISLLAGWLHAAALDRRGLDDVTDWALDETDQAAMGILKRDPRAARNVEANLHSLYRLAPETRGSLFATVQAALAPMLSDRARRVFCPGPGEHLDIEQFIRGNGTAYVLAPQTSTTEVAPLISAFVDEYTEVAVNVANTSLGNRIDPPPGLFLDEVANIAPLEHLPELMSYAAGSGLFVCVILQEFAQARDRWGENKAQIMWGNATVKVAFGALAAEDAQRFADEAGRYWAQTDNTQYGPGGTSHSPRTELREVMLASEVRGLDADKGEALVIAGSTPPVKTRMRAHYKSKDHRRYAESVEAVRRFRTTGAPVADDEGPAPGSGIWER